MTQTGSERVQRYHTKLKSQGGGRLTAIFTPEAMAKIIRMAAAEQVSKSRMLNLIVERADERS